MVVVAAIGGLIVWLVACWALWRWVRTKTARIEHGGASRPDTVYRLQRLQLAATFGVLVVFLLVSAGGGAAAGALDHRSRAEQIVTGVAVIVAVLVGFVALIVVPRIPRRALARVRDVPLRSPDSRRNRSIGLVVGLVYAGVIVGGSFLVPDHGDGHVFGRLAVFVVAIALLSGVVLPLVIVRLRSRALPDEERARLQRLAEQVGVRVRDFRLIKGRGQKVANAAQLGLLPGLRYVVVTDYLADHLQPVQLEAVVAHELGHAKRHHLLVKLGAVVVVWAALDAALLAVSNGGTALLVVPIAIAFPVGILLVQGLVGVRLETAADDVAAREVGAEHLASALEEIGRLNDTKRDTGRGWAVLTQHPGLQTRLDRLRGASVGAPRGSGATTVG